MAGKNKNKKEEGADYTVSVKGADGEFKESQFLTNMMNGNSSDANTPGVTKEIVIKKAKIDSDECLSVDYSEHIILTDGLKRKDISGTIKREGKNKVHEDLKKAFEKFNPHIALIAEMIEYKKDLLENLSEAEYKEFDVRGIVISDDGIILTGQKMLSTGKILNLVTPLTGWDDDYKFISELGEAIEECKHEAQEYLNGKMAPPAQQELELKVEDQNSAEAKSLQE